MKDFSREGPGHSAAFKVGLSQAGTPQTSPPRFSQPLSGQQMPPLCALHVCLSSFMVVWKYSICLPLLVMSDMLTWSKWHLPR